MRAHRLDAPFVEIRPAAEHPPRCRKSAPHRRRPRTAGSDSSPKPPPAYRSVAQTRRDADRQTAAPALGPACRSRRSCRSRPSTARRRSPSSATSGGKLCFHPRDRLINRRQRCVIDLRAASCSSAAGSSAHRAAVLRPREAHTSARAHAEPPEYRKTGSRHRSRTGGSAATSPPPQASD